MSRPPARREPITVTIVLPDDAPRTEADWTPAEERSAIQGLATMLDLLSRTPEPQPAPSAEVAQ